MLGLQVITLVKVVQKVGKVEGGKVTMNTIDGSGDHKDEANGQYRKVAALIREWIDIHKGEAFDLDTVCRHLQVQERDNRKYVAIELSKLVGKGTLEKVTSPLYKPIYRYIDNTCKYIDWVNAPDSDVLDITLIAHPPGFNRGAPTPR